MTSPPISQFVVLRHQVGSNPTRDTAAVESIHYDWMFLIGDELRTWSTDVVESLTSDRNIAAMELPPHRTAYLEIEGDIGGGRGYVSQIARGTFKWTINDDSQLLCHISWTDSDNQSHQQMLNFQRSALDLSDEWELRLGRTETNR